MSRVGKQPIPIPAKTQVDFDGQVLKVKGEKGVLSRPISPEVRLEMDKEEIRVKPVSDHKSAWALWGLTRTLVANMVTGVSQGFSRVLEINGIGYRAEAAGDTLTLVLGFSKPVVFKLPAGVSAEVDKKNNITLSGIDKELLGRTAAAIRALRPPEPYKGKGIKYAEERIIRKAGKTGAK
ncbi:MAG: 50S ribosomal protein L6 [Deltaproteobacteria bacterium]|nr:50S ribosomal protein L6 [Deltaproteobacteria bacterium]